LFTIFLVIIDYHHSVSHPIMSFFSDIMQPGGGIMLIPFVRAVIAILLCCCISGAIIGVARIHMIVLTFLSAGLLFSLSLFEQEFKKVHGGSRSGAGTVSSTSTSTKSDAKTD
jgi:ribose/xylose/arabinose/galactoside ABC-type transport system permease subunit